MDEQTKLISYENLQLYNSLLKEKMSVEDAKSLKVVTLSLDKKKLLFYKVGEPVDDAQASYEIELPQTDLSSVMTKVLDATNGNIGIFSNGTIIDSKVSLEDFMTDDEINQAIQSAILKSDHLSRKIVTKLPEVQEAQNNVIYMLKDVNVVSGDAYEEWMLIGEKLEKVGSTETDLSNYYTKEQTEGKISEAKSAAITEATATASQDAQTKADTALQNAKTYVDEEIGKVKSNITDVEENVSNITEQMNLVQTNVSNMDGRITELENNATEISTASAEEIQSLFQ